MALTACQQRMPFMFRAQSREAASQPGSANIPMIIVMGQSNAVGYGQLTPSPIGNEIVWRGIDFPRGIGVSFAHDYLAKTGRSQVIVVQCAVGDTFMSQWTPGAALYNNALSYIHSALVEFPTAKPAVLLWWQGENDAELSAYPWASTFSGMVKSFRSDIGDSRLPVIFAQLDALSPAYLNNHADWAHIQAEQAQVSLSLSSMVHTSDVPLFAADGMHVTTDGLSIVGSRMAQAYFGVLDQ